MRNINEEGLAIIERFESLQLTAYRDSGDVLTIGWGHTGQDVYEGQKITDLEANQLLIKDLCEAESAVERLVTRELTSNQFSAIVSFVYNVGEGHFKNSTMLRMLNSENNIPLEEIANQFTRWVFDNGIKLNGLISRREAEKKLFLS